jgi:hypothetical protein
VGATVVGVLIPDNSKKRAARRSAQFAAAVRTHVGCAVDMRPSPVTYAIDMTSFLSRSASFAFPA